MFYFHLRSQVEFSYIVVLLLNIPIKLFPPSIHPIYLLSFKKKKTNKQTKQKTKQIENKDN